MRKNFKSILKSIYASISPVYRCQNYILDLNKKIIQQNQEQFKIICELTEKIKQLENDVQVHEQNAQEIKSLQSQMEKTHQQISENQQECRQINQDLCKSLTYKIYHYCPDDKRALALQDWYFEKTGELLNLDNPQTYNEKVQWLKLYDNSQLKSKLGDKLQVREWVKKQIGEQYLVPYLGTWKKFDDIDFSQLPKQFVLKCNHGSGYNIIVYDKDKLDIAQTKQTITSWMHQNYTFKEGLELYYEKIVPVIIAEKYLENSNHDLYDYKFWCFHGKVEYIQFLSNRHLDGGLKMAFYDRQWRKQKFVYSYPLDEKNMPKPDNLDQMITLAEKLATGFAHVRVDFYRLDDGTIYFGEMTFTSMSGTCKWEPKNVNKMMGDLIKLDKINVKK